MGFLKKTWRFRNAIEVIEYHTARYGAPGQGRVKRKKPTPEEMEKVNQRNRERVARHRLREHFEVNDYLVTLTYKKDLRPPDMETAKQHFGKEFLKAIRREYRKKGYEVKWLRNIEVGTKNGWHIHVVINRIPDADLILRKAWKYGKVDIRHLEADGEFRDLAAYITKTPKTDNRLRETSYSHSRNLPVPEPEKKEYHRWKTWKDIKVPEGYYLDKNAFYEGINPVTGHRIRSYTLIRLEHQQQEGERNLLKDRKKNRKRKARQRGKPREKGGGGHGRREQRI